MFKGEKSTLEETMRNNAKTSLMSTDNLKIKIKKVINAVLGGVGISVVLAALVPSAFLKGDARWTYQSNSGRVDVAFVGDVSGGQIDVQGKELRVDRPQWILNGKNNQGVMIHFPVSFFKNPYQIALTPSGDAKEISLEMRFRGEYWRVHDGVKPAWVRFKNVRLNGKLIVLEKSVWHNKPFIYSVQNAKAGQNLTLSFDIQKPFSFTDIRWDRLLGLFIACSVLIFCSNILRCLVNMLNKKDILQVIAKGYSDIDVVYRRAFWIIFGVLCFAFGFHTIQFMWGNHDWDLVGDFSLLPWDGRAFEGRYALHLFKKLFLRGVYLPFVHDVVSFLFLALNAVLLCIYWRLEKRIFYFVLCGLILTAQPFTLAMLYFIHMVPESFIGVTFILTSLIISEKVAFGHASLVGKGSLAILSIALITLSLATYPVLLNTIAVIFVGRLLVQSFEWDGSWKRFKSYFFPFFVSALNIILAILLHKIMLVFVFQPLEGKYNTQILPFNQLPERLLVLFKQSFHQLYEYNFPFISQGALRVFFVGTILIALYICLMGNIKQKIVRLILLGGALYATQAAMMVANLHQVGMRIEFFGLVVFETLIAVLVFTKIKKLNNLNILAAIGVVWVSLINDLDCLRVWKLGFDAEKMLWNRVLARMEIQKDFDMRRKYKIIQIGQPIAMRPRFHKKTYPTKTDKRVVLNFSYDAPFDVFHAYEFYYPTSFRGERPRPDFLAAPKYKAQLKRLWEAGILDKARAWPHENGLIVWRDVILFITDAKALENCKKQLAKEFPRQPQNTP